MSKEKYRSILSPQMECTVFHPSNLFCNTCSFENCRIYKQKPPFGAKNMLGYLPADVICSKKLTVFQEHSSRKTVSLEELIIEKTIIDEVINALKYRTIG